MGAFTYPRSEPGSAGHLDLVELLQKRTEEVRRLLEGVSDEAAARHPSESEWSIKEAAGHLCSYASHLHDRLYRIIWLEEPRLPAWEQHEENARRDPQSARLEDLLREFVAQRAETVEMLADLVHWNWARCGRHEQRGRLSVRQFVDLALAHDEQHLEQLRALTS